MEQALRPSTTKAFEWSLSRHLPRRPPRLPRKKPCAHRYDASSRCGNATRASWFAISTNIISTPSPLVSIRKFSIPALPAANWTNPSSAISLPTPTLAAKTANSTPSSSTARSFNLPFPFERERWSTAMALSFVIYYPNWRKQRNERPNISKRNSALSHAACSRPDCSCRCLAHRSASLELHSRCAMALFAGAMLRDRRLAFLFPLLALFAGDVFVGFHRLMFVVYASLPR